jgi:hypothetical protein
LCVRETSLARAVCIPAVDVLLGFARCCIGYRPIAQKL